MEFSAKGYPPNSPPSRKIINFFPTFFQKFLLAYNDVHVVKWILYDMGNSSEYFFDTFTKVRTCGQHPGRMSRVRVRVRGGHCMSLVFFMFQSILNIF